MFGDPFPMAHDDRATPSGLPIPMLRRVIKTTLLAMNVRRGRLMGRLRGSRDLRRIVLREEILN
jgi:hypothetical protein